MSMNKQSLFTTHIYTFTNKDAETEHDGWRKAIYELKQRDPGRVVSNHLGWQSSVPLHTIPQLAPLGRYLFNSVCEVAREENWAMEKHAVLIDGWANINGKGASNNFHNHPNSLLSGCYYIDVPPSSGDLVLRDPREIAYMLQPPLRTGNKAPVTMLKPVPGMLVIFPAWLLHAVAANQSDADRVSVAFNVAVGPRGATEGPR